MTAEAIQIITSEEVLKPFSKSYHVIKTVEQYSNGPSLHQLLGDPDTKDLPIFVFSVAGKTRGGKSFLLNLMIKYLESEAEAFEDWKKGELPHAFEWKGGKDSITKGLWICPKIFKARNKQDQEVGILLLDNQGLFDGEQTDGVSIAMSGISTALSHLQMFNLKEKITTTDLETVYRHLASENLGENTANPTLMFLVRDYLESEEGCGLQHGQKYINVETTRGTQQHQDMWKTLQNNFKSIQCLLLPFPGESVIKKDFSKSGDLSVIKEDFLKEVYIFFKEIFSPENLIQTASSNSLTGTEIYRILSNVNGKEADEGLSFFNVFTEHTNQAKVNELLALFKSRLDKEDLPSAGKTMEDVLVMAQKALKGPSAEEHSTKLNKEIVEIINSLVKECTVTKYKDAVFGDNIEAKHASEWPAFMDRLNSLVGAEEEKLEVAQDIFVEVAANYYKCFGQEILNDLKSKCKDLKANELKDYYPSKLKTFIEIRDFQYKGCSNISERCRTAWKKEFDALDLYTKTELFEVFSDLTIDETQSNELFVWFENHLYKEDLRSARNVMEDALRLAKEKLKGPLAEKCFAKLKKNMVQRINLLVKEWTVEKYKTAVIKAANREIDTPQLNPGQLLGPTALAATAIMGQSPIGAVVGNLATALFGNTNITAFNIKSTIKRKHESEWPAFMNRLLSLVGKEAEKLETVKVIFEDSAAHYYHCLGQEIVHDFQSRVSNMEWKDVKAYYIVALKAYEENNSFNNYMGNTVVTKGCREAYEGEKQTLQMEVQTILIANFPEESKRFCTIL